MTVALTDVYGALRDVGGGGAKARRVAEALGATDLLATEIGEGLDAITSRLGELESLVSAFQAALNAVDVRIATIDGRLDMLIWMIGAVLAVVLLVLGKPFAG